MAGACGWPLPGMAAGGWLDVPDGLAVAVAAGVWAGVGAVLGE
jgi:hypothetical protein